ncbi:MAG: GNAT family N-acetyltransferase [Clostridiales bacterium]|jgi:ribosomal protein S18 acetylase RimI-like enzyme|nr:GNAT family N-acetyltransferase [Clostridiales bacterium]
MVFRKAAPEDRKGIAKVIASAYADDFYLLTTELGKVEKVFETGVNTDKFYAAEEEGKIVAVTAVSNRQARAVYLNKKILRKTFGMIKGWFFGRVSKKEFETVTVNDDKTGYIEFVAVEPNSRGKGISKNLLAYIFEKENFSRYILDVKDNNLPAIKTYGKLGFVEYAREKMNKRVLGFDYKIFMSLDR